MQLIRLKIFLNNLIKIQLTEINLKDFLFGIFIKIPKIT